MLPVICMKSIQFGIEIFCFYCPLHHRRSGESDVCIIEESPVKPAAGWCLKILPQCQA